MKKSNKKNKKDKKKDKKKFKTIKKCKKQISKLEAQIKKDDRTIFVLKKLVDVNSIIASSLQRKTVLKSILDQTKILMNCNFSSLLLVDELTNSLKFEVIANEEEWEVLSKIRLKMGEGIAGTVWENGQPLLIEDARKDYRFSEKADEKTNIVTTSIIAVPLIVDGVIIGVMEAMNKNEGFFDHFDLEIFQQLSVQASVAIENSRLYEMAITDGMTHLFINKYFKSRLQEEFRRSERYENNLSLVIFDIDHFKKFNDTYGHQMGDEILIKVAGIIKKSSRASDIPCRYGGEEFTVILPETNLNGAFVYAENVRKRIEELEIEYADTIVKLTISAGVTSYPEQHCNSSTELIGMADSALYYSKENGRNRVSKYEPTMKKIQEI